MNVDFRFRGEFFHILDDKARLALPGKLREELAKSSRPEEVTAHCNRNGYATLYPYEQWLMIEDKIYEIPNTELRVAASREYIGRAERLAVDRAGRILLPQSFRQALGLEKEAVIVGGGRKMEIWERTQLEAQRAKDQVTVAQALSGLDVPL